MPSILITRKIEEESFLKNECKSHGYRLSGISFVRFSEVEISDLPDAEWIFFYSKQGFNFLFKHPLSEALLKKAKIATIGKGTSDFILRSGFQVSFTGHGTPDQVADQFREIARNKTVLFPRASNSEMSVQKKIHPDVDCIDLIVYTNEIIEKKLDYQPDVLIFTSPLNTEGFLRSNVIQPQQKIISIGPTTTNYLIKRGIQNVYESPSADEEKLSRFVFTLI